MAELWAKIIRLPSTKSIKIIGVIHHHLRCQKNSNKSPAMPKRLAKLSIKRICVTSWSKMGIADGERVIIPQSKNGEFRIANGELRKANSEKVTPAMPNFQIRNPQFAIRNAYPHYYFRNPQSEIRNNYGSSNSQSAIRNLFGNSPFEIRNAYSSFPNSQSAIRYSQCLSSLLFPPSAIRNPQFAIRNSYCNCVFSTTYSPSTRISIPLWEKV